MLILDSLSVKRAIYKTLHQVYNGNVKKNSKVYLSYLC